MPICKPLMRHTVAAITLAAVGITALAPVTTVAAAQNEEQATGAKDILVFHNGRTLEGRIVEETDTQITFEGEVSGIPLRTTYEKSEILTIKRGSGEETPEKTPARTPEPTRASAAPASNTPVKSESSGPVIYVATLDGTFASDIHAEPLRDMMEDAAKHEPDYLIIELDNAWQDAQFDESDDIPYRTQFDQLFYAEEIEPIFTNEVRQNWTKQPEIVFWVKNAMGGAAFMPFFSENMYFHPDGRIGGIGFIDEFFDGEEAFNEKQISLRIGHAEGILIARGYEPRLVRAMTREPYVLSYRLEGGSPVFLERMPESEDEIVLTDSGDDGFGDTLQAAVRGETNDVLTIKAETARQIGVSKGTVETLDELIFALGIGRDHVVERGNGERVLENWSRGLKAAQRQLPDMWEEFNEIQPNGGDERDLRRARGRQIAQLKRIINMIRRFDGALVPQQFGVPPIPQLEIMIEQIRLQNL